MAIAHLQRALSLYSDARSTQNNSTVLVCDYVDHGWCPNNCVQNPGTRDSLALSLARQVDDMDQFSKTVCDKFIKQNNTVYMERVPSPDQVKVPAATELFKVKPYRLPAADTFPVSFKSKQDSSNCSIF